MVATSNDPTLAGNAEVKLGESLSYGSLVRRRFFRNAYGVTGLVACILIILLAIFADFLAPYSKTATDTTALYSPPQRPHFFGAGDHGVPFVYGVIETMDANTYEITFTADPDTVIPIHFFVEGSEWSLLGFKSNKHLFGGADGQRVNLFGTDNLGRDVFSRTLHGTRVTLTMGFLVMLAAGIIGTITGVCSGYFGGTFDTVMQRIVEFFKAFPDLPLYLALIALLPRRADPFLIFIMFASILVLLRWPDLCRELRGKVLSMRALDYIRSAEAVGASNSRIVFRHILPNTTSHIIVWATYYLPEIILLESFLSFLGVGIQNPMVSWGSMLNQILDFQSFNAAPWMLAPVGMIVLSVLAFNALGDGLRDAIDPYSDA